MSPNGMKILGAVLLVLCLICIFVAVERYNANADNVRAMNEFQQSSPFGSMLGGAEMKPATPAATKYAILFAIVFGLGGVALLVLGMRRPATAASYTGSGPA